MMVELRAFDTLSVQSCQDLTVKIQANLSLMTTLGIQSSDGLPSDHMLKQ